MTALFDGQDLPFEAGDTLAAALLRAGIHQVGTSVNLGRPRGIEAGYVDVIDGETMCSPLELDLVDGMQLRSLPGRGRLPEEPDETRYDARHVHVDVLVVGAGAAGREAAEAASGRVLVVDEGPAGDAIGGAQYLPRTVAFGLYDDGFVLALQDRRRVWRIRAKQIVLATGARERSMVFCDNDRPGVMRSQTALGLLRRHQVLAGQDVVLYTGTDDGYAAAYKFEVAGARVRRILDTRRGEHVVATAGLDRITAVATSDGEEIPCDLLLVSGGWDPAVELWSHAGGKLAWDGSAFAPTGELPGITVVGAATGSPASAPVFRAPGDPARQVVDLTRDVTVADLQRAVGAGLRSMEHVKRYTTIGTGPDQGRGANVLAAGITAELLGVDIAELGTTSFRPPYTLVPFAALAGRNRGELFDPARRTAVHDRHVARGAVFEDVGQWKRPRFYPVGEESMDEAVLRECAAVRTSVGIIDGSTLGKIDVQGPDAAEFLDLVYTNMISTLPVGKAKYGVMCGVDGMVLDDGTVLRLGEQHFLMYTTTGGAAHVLDWLEEWLQTEWPHLRVYLTSVTEQWSTFPLVGPRSRDVLAAVAPELDVSVEGFPFMAWRDTQIAGRDVRVARISFSGELAYEVNVCSWHAQEVWDALLAAGEPHGITPYGTETMHVLRAEKGYPIIGQDTDGTVSPHDLGLGWAVSAKKPDFLGKRSFARVAHQDPQRKQLVGLLPVDGATVLPEGAQVVERLTAPPVPMLGHVTSSYRSAALGRPFALALVKGGRERIGATLQVPVGGELVPVEVTSSVLVDPEGVRRDG